jgi:hypothetical protein
MEATNFIATGIVGGMGLAKPMEGVQKAYFRQTGLFYLAVMSSTLAFALPYIVQRVIGH